MGDSSKIIACLGMPRSGSTLQYNLVRDILSHKFQVKDLGYLEADEVSSIDKWNEFDVPVIFKSHWVEDNWLNLIRNNLILFYTHRDIIEIYISGKIKFSWSDESFYREIDRAILLDCLLESFEDVYCSSFRDLTLNRIQEIKRISRYLAVDLSDSEIAAISDNWSVERTKEKLRSISLKSRIYARVNVIFRLFPKSLKNGMHKWGIVGWVRKNVVPEDQGLSGSLLLPNHISDPMIKKRIADSIEEGKIQEIRERYQDFAEKYGYVERG